MDGISNEVRRFFRSIAMNSLRNGWRNRDGCDDYLTVAAVGWLIGSIKRKAFISTHIYPMIVD